MVDHSKSHLSAQSVAAGCNAVLHNRASLRLPAPAAKPGIDTDCHVELCGLHTDEVTAEGAADGPPGEQGPASHLGWPATAYTGIASHCNAIHVCRCVNRLPGCLSVCSAVCPWV